MIIRGDSSTVEHPTQSEDGGSIPAPPLHIRKGLIARPITLRAANDFVTAHHRHNGRTARDGGKFAVSCFMDGELVGIAIVGNPISATYMDKNKYGFVAEVLRTCTAPNAPKGAVSFLYGICTRICRDMGFDVIVTYTLEDESGASLRGAGWKEVAKTKPCAPGWRKTDHLERVHQPVMLLVKRRWEKRFSSQSDAAAKCPMRVECGNAYYCTDHDICAADASEKHG
jgi:hypothetical protein